MIIISVQSKALKGHAAKLKEKFTYALKEDNDGNLDQKEENNQLLNLQERMGKIILKLAILKISVRFNIQWLREEHDKELNAAKENGTTETIEELDKLCNIMEDKKGDVMKIGEEWDMLMEQLKALQQSFNE